MPGGAMARARQQALPPASKPPMRATTITSGRNTQRSPSRLTTYRVGSGLRSGIGTSLRRAPRSAARPASNSFEVPGSNMAGRVSCRGWLGVTVLFTECWARAEAANPVSECQPHQVHVRVADLLSVHDERDPGVADRLQELVEPAINALEEHLPHLLALLVAKRSER